uniref:Uma2 family endonuclease n=1 Tax=Planktothricoides sp. SpSt-374 TaxID=2282167 RepID=A0A7C3ZJ77_9CYAN
MEQYPEDGGIYELVDGEIIEMRATRAHDKVAEFISDAIKEENKRSNLGYLVTRTATIKVVSKTGQKRGRNPDVSVIDEAQWDADLSDYAALEEPIQLAVEVVSPNWRDDYLDKKDEYQCLGVREYWIVDYLALASGEYIGPPKIPTVSVYLLDAGEYRGTQFKNDDKIISATFPELEITVAEIVAASQPRRREDDRS